MLILRNFSVFFYGLTALVDSGLLIFKASLSDSGVDCTGLLYTLVASDFSTLNSLATISERVELKSLHAYSLLARQYTNRFVNSFSVIDATSRTIKFFSSSVRCRMT